MKKTRIKQLIWLILIGFAALVGFGLLGGIGQLWFTLNSGADPASALNIVPNVPPDFKVKLQWLEDDLDTGREMEPFTRRQIESAYLRAWLQWNLSYNKGEPYGLKTYFAGPALKAVNEAVSWSAAAGQEIEQIDLEHYLKLHFYAADGSIIAFTDHGNRVAQLINVTGSEPIYLETTADYAVIMMLEDGNWRIRHWLRQPVADIDALLAQAYETGAADALLGQAADDNQAETKGPTIDPTSPPPPGFVQQQGNKLALDGQLYTINGINYYPQDSPWDRFWPEYNPDVVATDLDLIQSMGLNSIRIFIPFTQFGGAEVDEALLDHLADFLDQSADHELKVIVTLFDFRSDYRLLFWPESDRHLEAVVSRFALNPTILAWDIKNEPDLDYQHQDPAVVNAWLAHTVEMVAQYAPYQLRTIGWAYPESALTLSDQVDFISFHFYRESEHFINDYTNITSFAPHKPVAVTEYGLPTWNSYLFPHGHDEKEQAAYYAELLIAMRSKGVGALAWTLYDFPHVPDTVAGRFPWQTGPQKFLGVVRTDGTLKPAATYLNPDLNPTSPPIYPSYARFLKPFWRTIFTIGLLTSILLLNYLFKYRRKT